jgi:hypothetical protein
MYLLRASINWVLVHINQRFQSLHTTLNFCVDLSCFHSKFKLKYFGFIFSNQCIFLTKRWKISANWMCFLCLSHGLYHKFSTYSAIICYLFEVYNFLNIKCKPFFPQNIMILFHFISIAHVYFLGLSLSICWWR